jgi:hypothetical protein
MVTVQGAELFEVIVDGGESAKNLKYKCHSGIALSEHPADAQHGLLSEVTVL